MFFNISNHPQKDWSAEQLAAAKQLAMEVEVQSLARLEPEIIDIPLPNVPPKATREDVRTLAAGLVDQVSKKLAESTTAANLEAHAGMIAGPLGICHTFLELAYGTVPSVDWFEACSERCSEDVLQPDGTTRKVATYKFVQFREI